MRNLMGKRQSLHSVDSRPSEPVPRQAAPVVRLLPNPMDSPAGAFSDIEAYNLGLLHRYAPIFVAFDEREELGPPYPGGAADYHPRSVEPFMNEAKIQQSFGFWQKLSAALVAFWLPTVFALLYTLQTNRQASSFGTLLELLLQGFVVVISVPMSILLVWRANRQSLHGFIQSRGNGRLWPGQTAEDAAQQLMNSRSLSATKYRSGEQAWKRYFEDIRDRDRLGQMAERTVYGRVVHDPHGTVLQYWSFYAYNHFSNEHEYDWEVVMVFLGRDSDRPLAAAYSSHFGGRWRPWPTGGQDAADSVQLVDERPLVYVARGSHAQYFVSRPQGYRTTATLPLPDTRWWQRVRVAGGRYDPDGRHSDFVPLVSRDDVSSFDAESTHEFKLMVLPEVEAISWYKDRELWAKFWWLRYQGKWGGGSWLPWNGRPPINGPVMQTAKWSQPWAWVESECVEDREGSWRRHYDPAAARAEWLRRQEVDPVPANGHPVGRGPNGH